MSEMVVVQRKDGWFYRTKSTIGEPGILSRELYLFKRAMLSLLNNREDYEAFNEGNYEQRKKVIRKSVLRELDSLRDNLMYDLDNHVKIYPLISKKTERKNKTIGGD